MRLPRLLLILAIVAPIAASCGSNPKDWIKVSDNKDEEKDDKGESKPMVAGYWTGIFQERLAEDKHADPVPVELEMERSAAFKMVFPQKDGVYVSGDYREFSTCESPAIGRLPSKRATGPCQFACLNSMAGEYSATFQQDVLVGSIAKNTFT